mgnify:CR=1 FL=1
MAGLDMIFSQDILLDSEKFSKASKQFSELSSDMKALKKDISTLIDELAQGFDTPAGHKFVNSCKNGLLQPMEDQAAIIQHVSENLRMAETSYESVFTEFKELNSLIKSE